jgi:cupin 2 domain-containing protein
VAGDEEERMSWEHGRLGDASLSPPTGEVTHFVTRLPGAVVEEIHSGALPEAVTYDADVDEWVLVLAGAATLVVDGENLELGAGSWVLLPAGTPHTLVRTEPGTHWLAVTETPA